MYSKKEFDRKHAFFSGEKELIESLGQRLTFKI